MNTALNSQKTCTYLHIPDEASDSTFLSQRTKNGHFLVKTLSYHISNPPMNVQKTLHPEVVNDVTRVSGGTKTKISETANAFHCHVQSHTYEKVKANPFSISFLGSQA